MIQMKWHWSDSIQYSPRTEIEAEPQRRRHENPLIGAQQSRLFFSLAWKSVQNPAGSEQSLNKRKLTFDALG